jgi:hypothetical protein
MWVAAAAAAPGPLSKTTGEWHWSMATSAVSLSLFLPLVPALQWKKFPSNLRRWYDDDAITRFVNIFTIIYTAVTICIYFDKKKDFEKVEEKGGKDWRCASTSNGGTSSYVFNATRTMESNGRPGIYRPCGRRTSRSLRSWVGGGGREQERAFKKTTTPPLEHFWLYTIKKEEEEETEEKGTVDIFLSTLSI